MAKEIKIIDIHCETADYARKEELAEITRLVNQGWSIVAAGGFGGLVIGFIVLQKG